MLLHQFAHAIHLFVPTCRAYHHVLAGLHASFDVLQDTMRSGEIQYYVDSAQFFRIDRSAVEVVS